MKILHRNPEWIRNRIAYPFNPIVALYNKYGNVLPWKDTSHTKDELARSYIHHSYDMRPSKDTIDTLMEDTEDEIPENRFGESIADYIWDMCHYSWQKLWDAMNIDYNALSDTELSTIVEFLREDRENDVYRRMLDRVGNDVRSDLGIRSLMSENTGNTINKLKRDDSTDEHSKETNGVVVNNNVYGFNSYPPDAQEDPKAANSDDVLTRAVNDKQTHDNEVSSEDSTIVDYSRGKNKENVSSDKKESYRDDSNESKNKYNQKFGNGKEEEKVDGHKFHTPTELLEGEIAFRLRRRFFDIVFDDIDTFICLNVY